MSDWLDMARYPNLDPDDAVTGARLSELREVLLGHGLAPLPDGAWHAALGAATGTAEPADDPADGSGGPADGHLGSWWAEHQIDAGADHHQADTHNVTDPHFGGDHW